MSERFLKWQAKMADCKDTRQSFAIQLDWSKPEDVALIQMIAILKDNQDFHEIIRMALRILPAMLYEGRLDELFAAFPWVKAEFLDYMREIHEANSEPAPQTQPEPDRAEPQLEAERQWLAAEQEREWQERHLEEARLALEDERRQLAAERAATQTAIHQQLARLEDLLVQQGNQPIPLSADTGRVLQPNGPKQLAAPQFTAPVFDDDEDENLLEVRKDTESGKKATENFLKSIFSLNPSDAAAKPVN